MEHAAPAAELLKDRQDLAAKQAPMEKREVAGSGYDQSPAQSSRQPRAESVRGAGLARRRDVVVAALHGQERGVADGAGIDGVAAEAQRSGAQGAGMKDPVDVLDEVRSVEVHDRAVEVEEGEAARIGAIVLPGFERELPALAELAPEIGQSSQSNTSCAIQRCPETRLRHLSRTKRASRSTVDPSEHALNRTSTARLRPAAQRPP